MDGTYVLTARAAATVAEALSSKGGSVAQKRVRLLIKWRPNCQPPITALGCEHASASNSATKASPLRSFCLPFVEGWEACAAAVLATDSLPCLVLDGQRLGQNDLPSHARILGLLGIRKQRPVPFELKLLLPHCCYKQAWQIQDEWGGVARGQKGSGHGRASGCVSTTVVMITACTLGVFFTQRWLRAVQTMSVVE